MTAHEHLFPGKHFISTVLDALETKTAMSGSLTRVYLMRAGMAGVIVGVMYLVDFAIIAAFSEMSGGSLVPLGRMVGAFLFGFALVFIYYTKSELLTSNMMIVSIGGYYRRTSTSRAARILGLCYLGNLLGGVLVAVLVWASSLGDGRVGQFMNEAVDHKLAYVTEGATGWADLFVRAVLCNFMINLAMLLVYNGIIKDDFTKSLMMVIAVFVFAFEGFEHSVANTVLFTIVGFHSGIDIGLAAAQVGIVMLGNFVGGGLLIGWYYAYANDDRRYLRKYAATTAD